MSAMNFQPRIIKLIGTTQRETAIAMINNLPLGQGIELLARNEVKARTPSQNNLMWSSGCLQCISEQLWVEDSNGIKRLFAADTWHKYFKNEYLPDEATEPYIHEHIKNPETYHKWDVLPNGERELNGSTTDLTKYGMTIYMEKIYAFGSKNGVMFNIREDK